MLKPFQWSDKFLLLKLFPALAVVHLTTVLLHVQMETLPEYEAA